MNLLEDQVALGGGAGGSWFHCSLKTVSRGAGRSAVAAAAYRLGVALHDEKTDITHDYSRRSGVVATFIMAPEDAPEWALDAGRFWNAAEAAEVRRNACVAREVELALPDLLTDEERKAVVLRAAQYLVERYQVGVTVAIHEPGKQGDRRNHHAHLLFSTRRIGPDGFGAKTRELDDRTRGSQEITALRKHTAFLINEALEKAGHDEHNRVDYRSFKARGIARTGTKHLGPAAHQIEKKGRESRRGDRNREIRAGNDEVDQIVVDLAALEAELQQVQEALLDERYGPLDDVPQPDVPDSDAPSEPFSGGTWLADLPEWWGELREPPPLMAGAQLEVLMNEAAAPYLAQIEEHGSLQDGEPEGMRFHERIAARAATMWRGTTQWARGKWQSLVANRRNRADHTREGPDLER